MHALRVPPTRHMRELVSALLERSYGADRGLYSWGPGYTPGISATLIAVSTASQLHISYPKPPLATLKTMGRSTAKTVLTTSLPAAIVLQTCYRQNATAITPTLKQVALEAVAVLSHQGYNSGNAPYYMLAAKLLSHLNSYCGLASSTTWHSPITDSPYRAVVGRRTHSLPTIP